MGHFRALRGLRWWPFFWRVSVESLALPLAVVGAISWFVEMPGRPDLPLHSPGKLLFNTVVFAPIFETLIFQALPVALARSAGWGFRGQFLLALLPFAAAHFYVSVWVGLGAGLLSGLYLAFTYVHWRTVSWRAAFWMTTGIHAVHNLIATMIVIFGAE